VRNIKNSETGHGAGSKARIRGSRKGETITCSIKPLLAMGERSNSIASSYNVEKAVGKIFSTVGLTS
jgi:hypothetical protein